MSQKQNWKQDHLQLKTAKNDTIVYISRSSIL